MAVQQNRKTPSKRDKRRTHDALGFASISTDSKSGERHRRHHITEKGFYRGRQAIVTAVDVVDVEDDD